MKSKQIEQRLAKYASDKGISALYLFGSSAIGKRTALSDIDIAILLPEDFPKERYFDKQLEMIAELMELLHEDDIDLIVLNEAPPLLKHRVITQGKMVFCRDEQLRNRFEAKAILEYLDFKPVLDLQYHYLKRRLEKGEFGVRPRYYKVALGKD
jgi:hypothetical protein